MSRRSTRWQIAQRDREKALDLARELGINPVAADILLQRGYTEPAEVRSFLNPDPSQLHNPFLLPGMREAVERVKLALDRGERLLIYGDYDVDGLSSTALLTRFFREIGANVECYIPHRMEEGYGLHAGPLADFAESGGSLVITVDCGITASDEVRQANAWGLDVIITDHHTPDPANLPPATAIINPKLPSDYPFGELAGVGVALKLVQAVAGLAAATRFFDLAALGTIADIVPLVDENRVIVHYGLQAMNSGRVLGLKALIEEAQISTAALRPGQVSFMLAPRLNAAGRLADARLSLELLLTEDPVRARELAQLLSEHNAERQAVEQAITDEALEMASSLDLEESYFLLLAKEGWHHGVIGIVASRLVDRFHRPVILLGLEGDEAKGSGRSIPRFSLIDSLRANEHLLAKFGGHHAAAGLSLNKSNIEPLRQALNELAKAQLQPEDLVPRLRIDGELDPSEVTLSLINSLEQLGPYGFGHPEPTFCSRRWQLQATSLIGREKQHLKLRLQGGGLPWEALAFRRGDEQAEVKEHSWLDIAYTAQVNEWNGQESVSLFLKDWRLPEAEVEVAVYDARHLSDRSIYLSKLLDGRQTAIALFWPGFAHVAQQDLWRHLGCWPPQQQPWQEICYLVPTGSRGWRTATSPDPTTLTDLVLLEPPYSAEQRRLLAVQLAQNLYRLRIHLLYNDNDVERAFKLMEAQGPNRQALATLYRGLQQLPHKDYWTFTELEGLVRTTSMVALRDQIIFQLQVMAELGLLTWSLDEQGAGISLRWLPTPTSKLSLDRSPSYTRAREYLSAFGNDKGWLTGPDAAGILARNLQSIISQKEDTDR